MRSGDYSDDCLFVSYVVHSMTCDHILKILQLELLIGHQFREC